MKWVAVNKSNGWRADNAFQMNNINDENEVIIHHSLCSEMTSRPIKKFKYTYGAESDDHSEVSSSSDPSDSNPSSRQKQTSPVANNNHSDVNSDKSTISTTNDFDSASPVSNPSHHLLPESSSQHEEEMTTDVESSSGGDGGGGGGGSGSGSSSSTSGPEVDSGSHATHSALRLWQSRQIAQGIFDNVINKVLSELGVPLHINDPGNHNLNEFVNWGTFLNAQNIENEGVAEAIRQQGLQRKRFEELWRHQQHGLSATAAASGKVCENAHRDLKGYFYNTQPRVMTDGGSNCTSLPAVVSSSSGSDYSSSVKKIDGEMTSKQLDITSLSSSSSSVSHSSGMLTQQGSCDDEVVTGSSSSSSSTSDLIDDIEVSLQSEDLLNTAVTCAISEKGLEVLNEND